MQLLAKGKVLNGYMIFVNRVRKNLEKQKTFVENEAEHDDTEYKEDLEIAINEAIDYTWERREELIRAEEYEDGKREGLEVDRAEGEENSHRYLINRWLQKGKTIAEIADDLGKSEEYVEKLMKN